MADTNKTRMRLNKELCPGFDTREDVAAYLKSNDELWQKFNRLPVEFRENFIGYCLGEHGWAVTNDPVFKKIFDPEAHKERVESLLSALLQKPVKIADRLPLEGERLVEKGSYIVMDMVVQLEDESYADLEMQKIGYKFPLERSDCYGADLIMRQYTRLRSRQNEAEPFNFKNMRKVYCIVLMEQSPKGFLATVDTPESADENTPESENEAGHSKPPYVHRRWMRFDTGIFRENRGLHEDVFICLDIFRQDIHNTDEDSRMLGAWLTFLSATDAAAVMKLVTEYPEFWEIYQEIAEFAKKPEALMGIFSEELRIMDRNTELEMRKDMEMEAAEWKTKATELKGEITELKGENTELKGEITELTAENTELKDTISEKDKLIAQLQAQLNSADSVQTAQKRD